MRRETGYGEAYIELITRKTGFHVVTGMGVAVEQDGLEIDYHRDAGRLQPIAHDKYVANRLTLDCRQGQETVVFKYVVNVSSLNHQPDELMREAHAAIQRITRKGFDKMLFEQKQAWADKWETNDVVIER